jgi:hypothetical protein
MRRVVLGVLGLAAIAVLVLVVLQQLDERPVVERTVQLAPGQFQWFELPMEAGGTLRMWLEPRGGAAVTFVMLQGEASWRLYRDNAELHAAVPRPPDDNWARDFIAMLHQPDFRYVADATRLQFPHSLETGDLRLDPGHYVLVIDNTSFGGGGRGPIEAQLRIWTGGGG